MILYRKNKIRYSSVFSVGRRLMCLYGLMCLCLMAKAQHIDLENITDPRQRNSYIKRNSKKFFFREARYGEAITPRDTAVYLVYFDFMLGANERRQQETPPLPPLSQEQIKAMVTELDVNYGNYSRLMIYCDKDRVLPSRKPEFTSVSPIAEGGDRPTPQPQGGDTPPPLGNTTSAVDPPLPPEILRDLMEIENYPIFVDVIQEYHASEKIRIMGSVQKNNELDENYIAVFNKDDNKLLAILEPQTNRTFINLATRKPCTLNDFRAVSPNLKLLYFK